MAHPYLYSWVRLRRLTGQGKKSKGILTSDGFELPLVFHIDGEHFTTCPIGLTSFCSLFCFVFVFLVVPCERGLGSGIGKQWCLNKICCTIFLFFFVVLGYTYMFIMPVTFLMSYYSYLLLRGHSLWDSLKMLNSVELAKCDTDVGPAIREDSEYVRLVTDNSSKRAEAEVLQSLPVTRLNPVMWWVRVLIFCSVGIGFIVILLKWGVPFLFEKVLSTHCYCTFCHVFPVLFYSMLLVVEQFHVKNI